MWFTEVEIRMGATSINSVFSLKANIFIEFESSFPKMKEPTGWQVSFNDMCHSGW